MPAPVPPDMTHRRVEEPEKLELLVNLDVLSWRYEQLVEAGYPVDVAIIIGERGDVDLHDACKLLEQGASVNEALRILL